MTDAGGNLYDHMLTTMPPKFAKWFLYTEVSSVWLHLEYVSLSCSSGKPPFSSNPTCESRCIISQLHCTEPSKNAWTRHTGSVEYAYFISAQIVQICFLSNRTTQGTCFAQVLTWIWQFLLFYCNANVWEGRGGRPCMWESWLKCT